MKTIGTMSMNQVVRKQSDSVQRSACLCSKPVLQALLLGAVYSVLCWTVMAQEPLSKPGEPQKVAAPAREEIDTVSTKAEAGLYSEAVVIEEQAETCTTTEGRGESLV